MANKLVKSITNIPKAVFGGTVGAAIFMMLLAAIFGSLKPSGLKKSEHFTDCSMSATCALP